MWFQTYFGGKKLLLSVLQGGMPDQSSDALFFFSLIEQWVLCTFLRSPLSFVPFVFCPQKSFARVNHVNWRYLRLSRHHVWVFEVLVWSILYHHFTGKLKFMFNQKKVGINVIIYFIINNLSFLIYILWDKNASFLVFGSLLLFLSLQ